MWKRKTRAAIQRVVTDMLEADGIIDSREMQFFASMRDKYALNSDVAGDASNLTLTQAMDTLLQEKGELCEDLVADCVAANLSDGYFARGEALLMLALDVVLGRTPVEGWMVSIDASDADYDERQMLYVESEFDTAANRQIEKQWCELYNEVRLMGFDLVYIPHVAKQYKSIEEKELYEILALQYPSADLLRLKTTREQLCSLTTEKLCTGLLAAKMDKKVFSTCEPSLMMKIGEDLVNGHTMCNFMAFQLGSNAIESVRAIANHYSDYYRNRHLTYIQAEEGRFVVKGIHHMILSLLMLQKGTRSRVVLDTARCEISFPEAGVKLEGITRREKALYALFLVEAEHSGINFSGPSNAKAITTFKKREEALREKYRRIYKKFGGDADRAPDITEPSVRNPMISRIKGQIMKIGNVLQDIERHIIMRNSYGVYNIEVEAELRWGDNGTNTERIDQNEWWISIAKL